MINQQLLEYIKKQLGAGVARDEIERTLTSGGGWAKSDVDEAFSGIVSTKPEIPTQNRPLDPYILSGSTIESIQRIPSLLKDGLIGIAIGFFIFHLPDLLSGFIPYFTQGINFPNGLGFICGVEQFGNHGAIYCGMLEFVFITLSGIIYTFPIFFILGSIFGFIKRKLIIKKENNSLNIERPSSFSWFIGGIKGAFVGLIFLAFFNQLFMGSFLVMFIPEVLPITLEIVFMIGFAPGIVISIFWKKSKILSIILAIVAARIIQSLFYAINLKLIQVGIF